VTPLQARLAGSRVNIEVPFGQCISAGSPVGQIRSPPYVDTELIGRIVSRSFPVLSIRLEDS
jgi:hypothetical protein